MPAMLERNQGKAGDRLLPGESPGWLLDRSYVVLVGKQEHRLGSVLQCGYNAYQSSAGMPAMLERNQGKAGDRLLPGGSPGWLLDRSYVVLVGKQEHRLGSVLQCGCLA